MAEIDGWTGSMRTGVGVQTSVTFPACPWCSDHHSGRCPMVKAIEYHPNGTVKRVEFVSDERNLTDGE